MTNFKNKAKIFQDKMSPLGSCHRVDNFECHAVALFQSQAEKSGIYEENI